jgi:hypothetical protein
VFGHQDVRKNVVESLRELLIGDQARLRTLAPTVPSEALHEILINAYMHRCWRSNGPVVITIDDNSVEIANPGDLLPGLHVDNLINAPLYRVKSPPLESGRIGSKRQSNRQQRNQSALARKPRVPESVNSVVNALKRIMQSFPAGCSAIADGSTGLIAALPNRLTADSSGIPLRMRIALLEDEGHRESSSRDRS